MWEETIQEGFPLYSLCGILQGPVRLMTLGFSPFYKCTKQQAGDKRSAGSLLVYFGVSSQKFPDFKSPTLSGVKHLQIPTLNKPRVKQITSGSSLQCFPGTGALNGCSGNPGQCRLRHDFLHHLSQASLWLCFLTREGSLGQMVVNSSLKRTGFYRVQNRFLDTCCQTLTLRV